jgi:hypothetical protein
MDTVLKGEEEMEAAAQHLGLITGFIIERDQPCADRSGPAPQFFDDGDTVVSDIAHHARAKKKDEHKQAKPGGTAEHDDVLHGG